MALKKHITDEELDDLIVLYRSSKPETYGANLLAALRELRGMRRESARAFFHSLARGKERTHDRQSNYTE